MAYAMVYAMVYAMIYHDKKNGMPHGRFPHDYAYRVVMASTVTCDAGHVMAGQARVTPSADVPWQINRFHMGYGMAEMRIP